MEICKSTLLLPESLLYVRTPFKPLVEFSSLPLCYDVTHRLSRKLACLGIHVKEHHIDHVLFGVCLMQTRCYEGHSSLELLLDFRVRVWYENVVARINIAVRFVSFVMRARWWHRVSRGPDFFFFYYTKYYDKKNVTRNINN